MDWRIYYGDGSTFSSEDGDWAEAPAWGVEALVTPDELVGREVDSGDFYVWAPWGSKPWTVDAWGLMDILLETGRMRASQRLTDLSPDELEMAGVKFGRSIDNEAWRELWAQVILDPDFPQKSARLPDERPA